MKSKNLKMRWPYPYPTRGDVISVVFVIFVLCLVVFCFVWFPNLPQNAGTGFGPDWDCTAVPNGEPICLKRLDR